MSSLEEHVMATSTASRSFASARRTVGVIHLLVTGALTGTIAFILCWPGTFVPFSSPTHENITLFTAAPVNSLAVLVKDALWSLIFGGLVGALFAFIYNSTARLDR
jgi:hypothetical protein